MSEMLKEDQKSSSKFPFFSIANHGALLSSFDIPEPIIHPPGTDPYPVSNPNHHTENGFGSLPALDMDPCAVSVFVSEMEFFSRTTELTVSEHAGGTLSEPAAMESTTSYSPANSGVVAQKIADNVTVINIRAKDTQSVVCDICNVACNTEDVFDKHKQGKRHQKNVQKLAVSSPIKQEVLPPAKDATLRQEPEEKKKQDLVQSEESIFVCGIRDVLGSVNRNIFTDRIEAENLTAQQVSCGSFSKDGFPNRTSVSLTTVQPSTDKAQHKPIVHKTHWCELCDVCCDSDKTFQNHILGKKHKKKLESLKSSKGNSVDSERIPPIDSVATPRNVEVTNSEKNKSTRCDLCGICCNTYEELNKHNLGQKHQKKLKNSKHVFGGWSMEDDDDDDDEKRCKRKANWGSDEEDGDGKKQKLMMMMMEEMKPSFSCKVCNVVCTSLMDFTSHLASLDHSAMVLKQVESNEVQL
ncbi:hypothetical protein OSB04_003310 [Centaurea solstitialis]|uniref:C2H2-type domain-containing protein n=1 Tax=Centaurea solstitialis TaxID=347529 RepID=A0AA38TUW7_9ASTR|nr:hypothetical protein OSB04_003310 [Centaurea solstitialis]